MKLKDVIEQHPVILLAGVFATGVAVCWSAAQVLWIGPRDYTIQELRTKVTELEASQGKESTSAAIQEPPDVLPHKVYPGSAQHSHGSWLSTLVEHLAGEGRSDPNTVLIRLEFLPFAGGYRRCEIEFQPSTSVQLAGGYAFYVRVDKQQNFYYPLLIDYARRSITIPQSRKGDYLVMVLRLSAPKSEQIERLTGIKVR
jgi:hypothetical protein